MVFPLFCAVLKATAYADDVSLIGTTPEQLQFILYAMLMAAKLVLRFNVRYNAAYMKTYRKLFNARKVEACSNQNIKCIVNGNLSIVTVNNHKISSDVPDGVVFTSSDDVRYKNRPSEGYIVNFQGNQPQISYFNGRSDQGSPSAAPVVLDGLVVTHGVNGGPSVEDTPLVLGELAIKYRDVRPKEPTTYATQRHSDISSSNLPQCKKDKAKFTSSTYSSASADHTDSISSNLPQCKKDKTKFTSSTFSSASTDHVQNSRLLSGSFTSPASSSSHSYDSPSYNSDPLLNGLRPLLLDKESTSQEFKSPSTGNAVTKLMESPHRKTDFSQRLPLGWRETIDPKDWQWIGQHLFASKGVLA
ncbi:hypothetical protein DAPPUDRAFT_264638 [Daphnia pulex]|uniref:Uncharacterized protein n=1 Tax=Daphnia pulex TaxID=6669 RepID=E9HS06_DAPPU|nr:hypothetical protein DAPPUDRAFT_264638 [Daphnia pulex]|eukprot:EFX65478.1 hypothetical protein DAPPUDRAFT_264638 [Daphnia pulex]